MVPETGKPAAYDRLKQLETLHQPSLAELLLALPQVDEGLESSELELRSCGDDAQ